MMCSSRRLFASPLPHELRTVYNKMTHVVVVVCVAHSNISFYAAKANTYLNPELIKLILTLTSR